MLFGVLEGGRRARGPASTSCAGELGCGFSPPFTGCPAVPEAGAGDLSFELSNRNLNQPSRSSSSLSQFEKAIGHGWGRGGGDGQSLVDCFQDEAAGKRPSEGGGGARGGVWRDGPGGGPE